MGILTKLINKAIGSQNTAIVDSNTSGMNKDTSTVNNDTSTTNDNRLQNVLASFENRNTLMEITDLNSYYKALRDYYEKYGNVMLNLGVIMRFLHTYHLDSKLNKSVADIQKDLETIANGDKLPNEKLPIYKTKRWREIKSEFPNIYDAESYLNTLEIFYDEFFNYMFDKDVVNEFIRIYQLDTKFNISYRDVMKDLHNMDKQLKAEIAEKRDKQNRRLTWSTMESENKTISSYKSYTEVLKEYYLEYGKNIDTVDLVNYYRLKSRFGINFIDVDKDLDELEKTGNITLKQTSATPIETQNKQKKTAPPVQIQRKQNQAVVVSSERETQMSDYNSYMIALKLHYDYYDNAMFEQEKILDFIKAYHLDTLYGIKPDEVKKDLGEVYNITYAPSKIVALPVSQMINRTSFIQVNHEQNPSTSNIPLTQPQGKQKQTTSNTPPVQSQSILDEQKLFYYIKSKPVKWEFGNPNALQNEVLKKLCTVFLSSESVSNILSPERCANMELIIQQKRARTPRAADYNKVIDVNILYELYKYSYLMTTFQVLENRKNDTMKIDRVKLWDLIQGDCRKRLENLEQEKRNNSTIRNMFQKYEYDTAKIKMVVNDYVEPREYDYIYASLMTNTLLAIIMDCVLNGEADIGNGYQPILQIIKQYSAGDLMAALDASLNSVVNFTLGMYANGGKIPRRPQ